MLLLQGTCLVQRTISCSWTRHAFSKVQSTVTEMVGTSWLHVHICMYMPYGGAYFGHCVYIYIYIYGDVYVCMTDFGDFLSRSSTVTYTCPGMWHIHAHISCICMMTDFGESVSRSSTAKPNSSKQSRSARWSTIIRIMIMIINNT